MTEQNPETHFEEFLESKQQVETAQEQMKTGTLKIISLNITSWGRRASRLLDVDADILAMQEVRLGKLEIIAAKRMAKTKGWKMIAGKEQINIERRSKEQLFKNKVYQRYKTKTAKQGGVAILAKSEMMMKEVGKANGPAKMLYATRRWTWAAIPLSKKCESKERKFLHISNMHNNPGSTRIDRTQK